MVQLISSLSSQKFLKVDDYIWSAWVSKKMSFDHSDCKTDFSMKVFNTEDEKIKPLVKEIEDVVQKELFPEKSEKSENSESA